MRRARAALLFAAATVASSLTVPGLGAPTNFWLLRQPGVVSADEDQLVDAFCRSLRSGDSTAAERALAALSARPIAVEFEPTAEGPGTVVELEDGVVGMELGAAGPKAFLLPGSRLARVQELDSSEGGLGARVWDASVGLGIWLCRNEARIKERRVLELGSGVGLSGFAAALAGAAAVTLSEVAEDDAHSARRERGELGGTALLDSLARSARRTAAPAAVEVRPLDWAECLADDFAPSERFPVVVGADLVHADKYPLAALAAAVVAHTAPGGCAFLMSAAGRPGLSDLPAELIARSRAGGTEGSTVARLHAATTAAAAPEPPAPRFA